MGRKIPVVSFLCGGGFSARKKGQQHDHDGGPATTSPPHTHDSGEKNAAATTDTNNSPDVDQSASSQQQQTLNHPSDKQQQQQLPPPPGWQTSGGARHTRSASYHHHHHHRSGSSASNLLSSMSTKVLGTASFSRQSSTSGARDRDGHGKKQSKHQQEDSIWKKTIILGEKCKVPDEDDEDAVLYDEKGRRISTYHKKSGASAKSFSRQNSSSSASNF